MYLNLHYFTCVLLYFRSLEIAIPDYVTAIFYGLRCIVDALRIGKLLHSSCSPKKMDKVYGNEIHFYGYLHQSVVGGKKKLRNILNV